MTDVAPTLRDRLWRSFRELVRAELPFLTFYGRWDYTVQAVAADMSSADVVPASSDVPLPAIPKCALAPSLVGENVKLAVGGRCVVAFRNGDPSKPEIVGGDYGSAPTKIALAGGGPAAARVGDAVSLAAVSVNVPGTGTVIVIGHTNGSGDVVPAFAFLATGISTFGVGGLPSLTGLGGTSLGAQIGAGSSIVGIGG